MGAELTADELRAENARLRAALAQARTALEVLDSGAACAYCGAGLGDEHRGGCPLRALWDVLDEGSPQAGDDHG